MFCKKIKKTIMRLFWLVSFAKILLSDAFVLTKSIFFHFIFCHRSDTQAIEIDHTKNESFVFRQNVAREDARWWVVTLLPFLSMNPTICRLNWIIPVSWNWYLSTYSNDMLPFSWEPLFMGEGFILLTGGYGSTHGPSQSGPYSRVRDLLATFTLNLLFYC